MSKLGKAPIIKGEFVYIIWFSEDAERLDSYFKIGMTSKIQNRVRQLIRGCPVKAFRAFYVDVKSRKSASNLEILMLGRAEKYKKKGEWFIASYSEYKEFFKTVSDIIFEAGLDWRTADLDGVHEKHE